MQFISVLSFGNSKELNTIRVNNFTHEKRSSRLSVEMIESIEKHKMDY